MHAISYDDKVGSFEIILSVGVGDVDVGLFAHIGLDPLWLLDLFALMIDVLAAEFEAGTHVVIGLHWLFGKD